jgi:hypothetical protein
MVVESPTGSGAWVADILRHRVDQEVQELSRFIESDMARKIIYFVSP